MNEQMTFPNTWEEYEEFYGFTDKEQVYTNGSRLILSFRVKQWLEHLPSAERKGKWIETNIKGMDYVYCSECQDSYYPVPLDPSWEYCPHCGADMRGAAQ